MRTARAVKGAAGNKGDGAAAKDVEAYLAGVPEPARTTLEKVRAMIRSVVLATLLAFPSAVFAQTPVD